MKIDFDFTTVKVIEFGVGREDGDDQQFMLIPVDGDVQAALRDMAQSTITAMQARSNKPSTYDPSEKHEATEYVVLPIGDDLATRMKALHEAVNLPTNSKALADPADVFCYFARLTDGQGRKLTCLRRASQFKAILKSRLIRLLSDALKLVEDRVFKLDADFDLVVDSKHVHILRPSAFEFAGRLQAAVLAAVPANIQQISPDLPFVDLATVEAYSTTHPRAARYLASIRTLKEATKISKAALKKLCKSTGVLVKESNGAITIPPDQVLGFLEVLDRRRYELELVPGKPERYRAGSREKLDN
jgi:hypothetical protein